MVLSDKTDICISAVKNCRIMNIGGLRGGHFRHANDVHLLGFGTKKKGLF